ncbi:MAG: thiol:disulfide interchange protein DsbA/DsbL [Georgfuchsia sp.]
MRIVKALFAAVGFFVFLAAANATSLQKGQHYDLISPPQPTDAAPGKIEVLEFFSYGCPHCYHLEPFINPWVKKLPKDVSFSHVPLADGQAEPAAKLFYSLQTMGVEDKMRGDVFASIHRDRKLNINDEAAIKAWVAKKGLDAKKFNDMYNSFGILTKAQHAQKLAASHKISGVPTIVVDGRYIVLKDTIQSYDDLLALTDQIIDMARASKK